MFRASLYYKENKTKPTNRLRCTALAVLQQTRGDEVARCALVVDGFTTGWLVISSPSRFKMHGHMK
jgi:hypothetical protein